MLRFFRRFAAAWKWAKNPAYVVLYDHRLQDGESREEWYGYFDSPEQALEMYTDAFGTDADVGNARLAVVLDRLPSRTIDF